MDEHEFEGLESRLRRSVSGHRPAAPDELLRFIDTVPERYRRRPRLANAFALPRLRAGFAIAATAAAVVVAVVAGMALVSVRNGQASPTIDAAAPSMGAGWSWQRADGTIVSRVYQVAHGYVGTCGASLDETTCTSPDGLHWTSPADPQIVVVAVEAGGQFSPYQIVRSGSVWVALDIGQPSGTIPVLWRSTDGLHWSQVDSPAISGLSIEDIEVVADGFAAIALGSDSDWALTSADGLTWARSSQLPVSGVIGFGPKRLIVGGGSTAGTSTSTAAPAPEVWQSLDGNAWTHLQMPANLVLVDEYALSGGGFVGRGWDPISQVEGSAALYTTGYRLLRSADGLSWQIDNGDFQGELVSLVAVGDRLLANVSLLSPGSTAPVDSPDWYATVFTIWQSSDSGRTWQPVKDSSGQPMSGLLSRMGDRLTLSLWDPDATAWRLTWVGTPPKM